MKKVRARRQRIPAFGEWNYDYGSGSDWPMTQYFDSAMQPGLVMALPPSPKHVKKVVKWSDSPALDDDEKQQPQRHTVVVGLAEHGMKKQGKQSRVADTRAHAADCNYKACRVVRAVDEDLYEIPPDMLCPHEPRKRLTKRSLWMGCLGLSCIA